MNYEKRKKITVQTQAICLQSYFIVLMINALKDKVQYQCEPMFYKNIWR